MAKVKVKCCHFVENCLKILERDKEHICKWIHTIEHYKLHVKYKKNISDASQLSVPYDVTVHTN